MSGTFERLKSVLADRYAIERELGAGAMATVFLAHDVRHNRKVALKVLRPEIAGLIGAERFLKEIETTANLHHPNILPLFDSGQIDGTVFYVMPYVAGETLRKRLIRETQLPVDDVVRIAVEIAEGLDYAHRHGVIHRDVKPDNVLFHDGRAVVADFGIALASSRDEGATRITKTGMSLGTPEYMSPEQAAGEQGLDARSDVYALGSVVYEMLVGEPPFSGPTAQVILSRVMTEEPIPVALQRKTVPASVDAAVGRALEKLPADRFQTAGQFAEALRGAAPGTDRRRKQLSASRSAMLLWALAAASVIAVAWVGTRSSRTALPSSGPVRFGVDLDPGTEPTFTPIVKLSADGRNVFLTANV